MLSTSHTALNKNSKIYWIKFISFHIHGFEEPLWCHNEVLARSRKTFDDQPTSRLWRLCSAWPQQRGIHLWSEQFCWWSNENRRVPCFRSLVTDWKEWFHPETTGYSLPKCTYNSQLPVNCIYLLCLFMYHKLYTPISRYNRFIHAHKSKCKFKTVSVEIMERFSLILM